MKNKNSSNNNELSVRERVELERELRRVAAEIRKEHSSDWREILKTTDVYKKLHNISDSENQNEETKGTSKQIKNTDSKNKNKFKKDIKEVNAPKKDIKSNISKDTKKSIPKKVILKENVETKYDDNPNLNSTSDEIKELDNIEKELRKSSELINNFYAELNNDGFLSFEKRENIIAKYSQIYKTISKLNKFPDSHKQKIFSEFDNLERFLKVYEDLINYINLSDTSEDNEIRKINENVLDSEISENEDFFKDIDDVNKKRAIVIDERNVRVNAGAGTGKTFTIQNKVKYLIERKGVSPDKILCLCYTVKGAADLDEKVNRNLDTDSEVQACTFHEFCRSVARDCGRRKTTDRTVLERAVLNYMKNLKGRRLDKLIEYFGYYINSPVDDEDYNTYEELLAYENGKDLKTLKNKFYGSGVSTLTMQGEIVKSIGELIIANYLFMHEIEYTYEPLYESIILDILENFLYSGIYLSLNLESKEFLVKNLILELEPWRSYKPDFYLPKYNIYLEHFGIAGNKNDEYWLGEDYINQMERKREFHKSHGTTLLETYYYYLAEGRLIEELEELLIKNGVEIGQMNREEILQILKDTNRVDDFENFIELVKSFINIFEAQNKRKNQFIEFKRQNKSVTDGYKRKRQELFLDIVSEIYHIYYGYNQRNDIDNNREVSLALELIQTKEYSGAFDYIFIDEYQDINPIRSLLLSSLQKITNAKLFVVGDDWQSIYRFNGSDLNLFIDFDKDFPNSELLKIQENRRNYDEVNDIASDFIMKNKKQEKKKLISKKTWKSDAAPIKIINYSPMPQKKKVLQLYAIIDQIAKDNKNAEILLLGRNNKDIEEYTGNSLFKLDNMNDHVKVICLERPELDIRFMSIHKSKGLEFDEVIILNFKDYFSGFPNKIEDDSVLRFLKDKEEYQYAEERRLLYVALTRTKNCVYLLSPKYNKSSFIKELTENYNIESMEFDVDEELEEKFTSIEKTPQQLEDFNKKLKEAKLLKKRNKNFKALKLFDECYKAFPENFKYGDKEDYAWAKYFVYVKTIRSEESFFKSVEFISKLVQQKNLRKLDLSCVYSLSILELVFHLKMKRQYSQMFLWLDKLDPKLLNPFPGNREKSKKELYYDNLTSAYYHTGQYEKCIEASKYALNNLDLANDSWFKGKINASLNQLGKTN